MFIEVQAMEQGDANCPPHTQILQGHKIIRKGELRSRVNLLMEIRLKVNHEHKGHK